MLLRDSISADLDSCDVAQGPELDDDRAATEMQIGTLKGAAGQWASCVRAIDPSTAATTCVAELDDNEGAVSLALVNFAWPGNEGTYLAVGTAQGLAFNPRQADGAATLICLKLRVVSLRRSAEVAGTMLFRSVVWPL